MPAAEERRSTDGRVEWLTPVVRVLDARAEVLGDFGSGLDGGDHAESAS